MSITHNFEERAWVKGSDGVYEWDLEEVRKLLDHARALEAMLKKHEWAHGDHSIWCPECREYKEDGHFSDCQLAKLLGEG